MTPQLQPSRAFIELASWHLVTELHRRNPDRFTVIEMHPGGGQYDCLGLYAHRKVHAKINRPGSFMVDTRFDEGAPAEGMAIPRLWERMLSDSDPRKVIDEASLALGLPIPTRLPSTTRLTLTYRLMRAILRTWAFSREPKEWRNGFLDTSGYGGGQREGWLGAFPQIADRLQVKMESDPIGQPAYRFWLLVDQEQGDSEPKLCLETTGWAHFRDGGSVDLMKAYRKSGSLAQVVGASLAEFCGAG